MASSSNARNSTGDAPPPPKKRRELEVAIVQDKGKYLHQHFPSCMWKEYLKNIEQCEWVAPVNFFKYAPFSGNWEAFAIQNLMIELPNPMCSNSTSTKPVNWVGTICGYAGYKALVVYYPMPTSPDEPSSNSVSTWIPFCSSIPKPLGYSIREKILLHPPTKNALEASIIGTMVPKMFQEIVFKMGKAPETVKLNHDSLVSKELAQCANRFHVHDVVEVIDKNNVGQYRLGVVNKIIGDRIFFQYLNESKTDQGFALSQNSPHIHKLGWCEAVGSPIDGVDPNKMLNLTSPSLEELDIPDVPSGIRIQEEMVFEMRHPFFPWKICPGMCVKVLKYGYFVASTDWTRENTLVEMVLHVTSDYILPVGFCAENDIPFEAPMDAFPNHGQYPVNGIGKFSWEKYLKKKKLKKFDPTPISKQANKFMRGCKLEVVKISKPILLRPATVTKTAGRLIQIHFDGKRKNEECNHQWMSCESSNIYPVGYAALVWHGTRGKPEAAITTSRHNTQDSLPDVDNRMSN